MLEINSKAPDFTLEDKDNNEISLSDFLGKKVILYFYPKDNTPGCTKQACTFRDNFTDFKDKNTVIIGISKDSTTSHKKFSDKYDLPFILLSDPEINVIKLYDVWKEKIFCGRTFLGIVRTTFIINEEGFIEKIYDKVKPTKNPEEVLEYLKEK